jgi:hypothetical protein
VKIIPAFNSTDTVNAFQKSAGMVFLAQINNHYSLVKVKFSTSIVTYRKALGKLGNIVAETSVILDVSANVHVCPPVETLLRKQIKLFASREAKVFPTNFRNMMFPYVSH